MSLWRTVPAFSVIHVMAEYKTIASIRNTRFIAVPIVRSSLINDGGGVAVTVSYELYGN